MNAMMNLTQKLSRILGIFAVLLVTSTAHAENPTPGSQSLDTSSTTGSWVYASLNKRYELTEQDVLLVITWHEAGFGEYADLMGIAKVLRGVVRRTKCRDLVCAGRIYSPRATGRLRALTIRDAISRQLRSTCERPKDYVGKFDTDACLRTAEVAKNVVEGKADLACDPDHWGGAVDFPRAIRGTLIPVDCGPSRNMFFRYPTARERGSIRSTLARTYGSASTYSFGQYAVSLRRLGLLPRRFFRVR